jgi:hypothetical protein
MRVDSLRKSGDKFGHYGRSETDQRMIFADLALNGRSAHAIHEDVIATLGCDAVAYTSVTFNLRGVRSLPPSQNTHPVNVPRASDDPDRALSSALDENPFTAYHLGLNQTTVPASPNVRSRP